MSYIQFDKSHLINLEYSLNKELLFSNRTGAYASSTLVNCHTRKYHGLLVVPQPQIDDDNHVLLSSVDEMVHDGSAAFNLGIRKYPGKFIPKGHKYLRDFIAGAIPKWIYRVGDVVLTKEILVNEDKNQTLVRYFIEKAGKGKQLQIRPYLAFRNYHQLSKANVWVNNKYGEVRNGIKYRMYQGYDDLFIQFSKKNEYVHVPDWYYNVEYLEEQKRGYDYQEDLYVPGFFEVNIKTGQEIIMSVGTKEESPNKLKTIFNNQYKKKQPRTSFENCLTHAASQFIVKKEKRTEVKAGYHWFGSWGRDTFIALPGLTLVNKDYKTFFAVVDTMLKTLKDGLITNMGDHQNPAYNSVDAPLWLFWALQQYVALEGGEKKLWNTYAGKLKKILTAYKLGTHYHIHADEDRLIYAGEPGRALTWMDAVVDGKPITPRIGKPVEINALWYNAICFCLTLAKKAKDDKFLKDWHFLPEEIVASFNKTFWDSTKGYLADYVAEGYKDWAVRPNQIMAISLPFSPLTDKQGLQVLETVKNQLLTPRGLRTLSPNHPDYIGSYKGGQKERDAAYHQGTVWPWLLGHFAEAYLKLHKHEGLALVEKIYRQFEETLGEHGIGTISEVFDGNPPHQAGGTISQAWSVAELLRIHHLIEIHKTTKDKWPKRELLKY